MERVPSARESRLVLAPLVALQPTTNSADDRSNPGNLIKPAFLCRIQFPFHSGVPALEIQLCPEDESVLSLAGAIGTAIEYGSLEIERIFKVAGEYPIKADCPCLRLLA